MFWRPGLIHISKKTSLATFIIESRGNFFVVQRFKSAVRNFRALKLYTMPRLETKYDLLLPSQINIASINLVSKSIYLLASSKFGQSLLVMRNYLEDLSQSVNYFKRIIIYISIYTLSDLGDLRNLIGSLSRTIQHYLPPSEWIMCELGFSHFLRERSSKSRQNPRVDFFPGKKRLRRIQNGVFPFTVVEFCGRWIVYKSRLFA